MPVVRRWQDPETGDYVVEHGRPRGDATYASTVVRLLRLRRGSSPVYPELGNRLFDELETIGNDAERRAEAYCREALTPLTSRNLIWGLTITPEVQDDAVVVEVAFVDQDGPQGPLRLNLSRGA